MTPTDALQVALAEWLHRSGINEMCAGDGTTCDSCLVRVGYADFALSKHSARDKMLLGFAVVGWDTVAMHRDDDEWFITMERWENGLTMPYRMTGSGTGPTPLAAVEAAIKEVRDEPRCHAQMDGDCEWSGCPQLRDGEPAKSGRHCPLDTGESER